MNDRHHALAAVSDLIHRYFLWLLIGSYVLAGFLPSWGLGIRNVTFGHVTIRGRDHAHRAANGDARVLAAECRPWRRGRPLEGAPTQSTCSLGWPGRELAGASRLHLRGLNGD